MVTAIVNAHVVPVEAEPFDGTLLVEDGKILALGPDVQAPDGADVLDAGGRWLLPGFIDAHTHLGVCEEGEAWAGDDTNEMTSPNTAGARALDAINPADLAFHDALTGGVTCVNITPGSANVIGGLMVAVHTHGTVVDEMVIKHPTGLKAALGENPKRVYGNLKQAPSTRLGIAHVLRQAWCDAQEYQGKLEREPEKTGRNLTLENMVAVLAGEMPFRQHCHRADDIATAIRVAEEFGYRLVVEHGTDGATIADYIAQHDVPVLMGPMLTNRAKVELRNRSLENPGRLAKAGVNLSLITDHPVVPIEHLVTSAILCVKHGLPREDALRALTINPAAVLGLEDRIGSLAVGKDADLVLWSADPLDVMSFADHVFIGGREVYTRGA